MSKTASEHVGRAAPNLNYWDKEVPMRLFKADHARRIDRIIDYFGGPHGDGSPSGRLASGQMLVQARLLPQRGDGRWRPFDAEPPPADLAQGE
jgi:hypothetical protein